MPLLTSPPISPANLMRLGGDFLSPKNGGGEAPRYHLEVELNGLTDLDELIKEAGLPRHQERTALLVQAVLANSDGEDVNHVEERRESQRVSDLGACFPVSAEAGNGPWTFGETHEIVERKLEDTYLQIRILNTSFADSPGKSKKVFRQVTLSPASPQTPHQQSGGSVLSPTLSPSKGRSPSPSRRGSSALPQSTNVQIVAQADIPLDSFPKSGDKWGGQVALTEGGGFNARKFTCQIDVRGALVRQNKDDGGGGGGGGFFGGKNPKSPLATALKKFDYFSTDGGLSGPLQRQNSKRNRKLSISGRVASSIVIARSQSKQSLSRSDSELTPLQSTREDGATEDLVRHMDSTFNNSLMVISQRFDVLTAKVKEGKAKAKEAKALPKIVRMVQALGDAARSISLIANAVDPAVKIRSRALEPDTIEDGIGSAKTVLNSLQDRFTAMMRSLKKKMATAGGGGGGFDVESLRLSDDSDVYDNLEIIDESLSDCVEAIDGCSHDLDERGFPAAATNALMFAMRLKRRGLKKSGGGGGGGGKIHPGAGLATDVVVATATTAVTAAAAATTADTTSPGAAPTADATDSTGEQAREQPAPADVPAATAATEANDPAADTDPAADATSSPGES